MLQAAVFTCFLLLFSLLLRGTLFFSSASEAAVTAASFPVPVFPAASEPENRTCFPAFCHGQELDPGIHTPEAALSSRRPFRRGGPHVRLSIAGGRPCSPRLFCPVMVIVVLSSLPSVPAHGFRQPWGTKETAYGSAGCADHGKQR